MTKDYPHWGTTLDALLAEDGILEAVKAEAVTRVVAWQLGQEMEHQGMTKAGNPSRISVTGGKAPGSISKSTL